MKLNDWTINRLKKYIGQSESIRVEFKDSRLLEKPQAEVAETLSKIVSGFSNTEGGVLIIGLSEDKGHSKRSVAGHLDQGTEVKLFTAEKLQRLIESHISPALSGLRVFEVPLEEDSSRAYFVIQVPVGTTAYQATDRKYYGRSEYEVKALLDNEIRYRMLRTQTSQARINISQQSFCDGYNPASLRQSPNDPPLNDTTPQSGIEYLFQIAVTNTGPLTINDFVLVITPYGEFCDQFKNAGSWRYKEVADAYSDPEGPQIEPIIFPGQKFEFPSQIRFWLPYGDRLQSGQAQLAWTVFLHNSPPSEGAVDISEVIAYKNDRVL